MYKIEYRAVIRFMYSKGMINDTIKTEMDSVYRSLASNKKILVSNKILDIAIEMRPHDCFR